MYILYIINIYVGRGGVCDGVVQPRAPPKISFSLQQCRKRGERKKRRQRWKTRSRPGSENRWSAIVGSDRRRWPTPERRRRRRAPGILSTGIPRTHQHARSYRPVAAVAVAAVFSTPPSPLFFSYTKYNLVIIIISSPRVRQQRVSTYSAFDRLAAIVQQYGRACVILNRPFIRRRACTAATVFMVNIIRAKSITNNHG